MSKIYSLNGGGYIAVTEKNGKAIVSEFTDIVDAAIWVKGIENKEVKEDEKADFNNSNIDSHSAVGGE